MSNVLGFAHAFVPQPSQVYFVLLAVFFCAQCRTAGTANSTESLLQQVWYMPGHSCLPERCSASHSGLFPSRLVLR